jgi:hypothetical protein
MPVRLEPMFPSSGTTVADRCARMSETQRRMGDNGDSTGRDPDGGRDEESR